MPMEYGPIGSRIAFGCKALPRRFLEQLKSLFAWIGVVFLVLQLYNAYVGSTEQFRNLILQASRMLGFYTFVNEI